MLYRVLHKLFGWDYIHWGTTQSWGITRVYVDGDGVPYFHSKYGRIYKPDGGACEVIWLTCPRTKYYPKNDLVNILKVNETADAEIDAYFAKKSQEMKNTKVDICK